MDLAESLPVTLVGPYQPLHVATLDEYTQWFTSPDGKFDSCVYVTLKDRFFMQGEVINYNPKPQDVYIQMDMEYVDGKVGQYATTTPVSVTGTFITPKHR